MLTLARNVEWGRGYFADSLPPSWATRGDSGALANAEYEAVSDPLRPDSPERRLRCVEQYVREIGRFGRRRL